MPEFSKTYQVITFDHRGFGFSRDDNNLGPKGFVADLEGLLAHLNIEKAALCGQSMGGITLGGFATRNPHKVSAMVLSCSGAGFFPVHHGEAFRAAVAQVKNYQEFSTLSIEQDGFPQRHPRLRFLFEEMAQLNYSFDMKKLADLRSQTYDPAIIANAKIPMQLIGGEDDNGANMALEKIKSAIPDADFKIIKNAGHLLFFEAPEEYNQIVLDFLATALKA